MRLNEKIYQHRRQLGLSQEQLAELLGVTRQAVSKWELGTSVPELETVVALAKTFGVTTDYLLTNEDPTVRSTPVYQEPPRQDWLDRLPGVIGKLVRRFGWLTGVYIAVMGGIFTLLGALARYIASSMYNSFNAFSSSFGSYGDLGMIGNFSDPYFESFNQQVNSMAQNNPVTIIGSCMMILGIVMLITGIVLAFWLKKKFADRQ